MEWLKNARQELNLSQRSLSAEIGCSQGSLCNWERGQRTPHLNDIRKIVALLKKKGIEVNASEVLGD